MYTVMELIENQMKYWQMIMTVLVRPGRLIHYFLYCVYTYIIERDDDE
jgi:hypothetical protein